MIPRITLRDAMNGAVDRLAGSLWVCDCRTFDIPNTIVALIRNAAPGMVAISLRPEGGSSMISAAERAARRRGVRILWVQKRRGRK